MSLDNLPVEWLLTSIENISEVIAGGTPKANDPENFVEPPNGIGWLTPADLSGYSHKYIGHGKRDLSEKGYKSSSAKLIPKGSVVFSSRAPIGYVAIASNEISTNQGFKNFVIDENISSEYLYYYLKRIRDLAESLGTGTTFKELSGSACKKLPFVLAPLAEQQEIVRQLDVMLAQVEQIKARLDAIPAILKKFRQSVLADAVSGKLTEEWRGKAKEWESTTLAECTHRIGDGLHGTPQYVENGEYHFVNGNNLIDGEIVIKESTKSVNSLEFEKHKRDLGENTLLLSINGTIGNLAFYQNEKIILGKSACYLNFNEKMNRDFGYILLSSEFFIQYAHEVATGATIKNVPLKGVRNYQFLLPSLEEQVEIVAKVKQLLALGSTIEQKIEVAQKRVNLLTQSILAKAFSGELTTEWREQHQELITGINSAESLLAAIQAEREASKPAKKTRKKKEV
ncbi:MULTISPECIES: restriction endonuclease subunit S [unclassified Acinetobacter]|uniref:restriction endonuclease subunit S n=1 Tax=unclassified Acinetobacter TaxID=196816 RepID=UPI0015D36896|nr:MULTISPECIES: restriction endonuclease subunit S [unclassified Acinetobacter]